MTSCLLVLLKPVNNETSVSAHIVTHTNTHTHIHIYIRPRFTAECQSVVAIVTAATWGLSTGFLAPYRTCVPWLPCFLCYFPMIRNVTIIQCRSAHFVWTQSHPTCCCLTWACRGWWWWRWWPARRTRPPWRPWWASRPPGCLLGRRTKAKTQKVCSACTAPRDEGGEKNRLGSKRQRRNGS